MRLPQLIVLAALVAGCTGGSEAPPSEPIDPSVIFTQPPPPVETGWPCPPLDIPTTEDQVLDSDGDSFTDCQEIYVGSNPDAVDTDNDGVSDQFEIGDMLAPNDYDDDGTLDVLDTDDDGDLILTADEGERLDDIDSDGDPNYIDADDDNDLIPGNLEDIDGDGSPLNDDYPDDDGIPNYLDPDDDNDSACCGDEDTNGNRIGQDDDTDGDGLFDWEDTDDDGDGILTAAEDHDGDGDPSNDNIDNDGFSDYQDVDEDDDGVFSLFEDTNGDGNVRNDNADGDAEPDYRDDDDDGDGITTSVEGMFLVTLDGTAFGGADGDAVLALVRDADGTIAGFGRATLLDGGFTIVMNVADDVDGDGLANFVDLDEDNDTCDADAEDADANGDPVNDDTDADDVPDYLDADDHTCTTDDPPPVDGTFTVDVLNDSNGNGSCDGGEDTYRVPNVSVAGDDVSAAVDGADTAAGACASFP